MGRLTRPVLHTERLRLEPLTVDHAEALVALDSDPEVLRHVLGRALTREEVLGTWLPRRTRADADARGLGYWMGVDPTRPDDPDAWLGWWCLALDDTDPTTAELGYRLRRSAWGRGLATEGARALVDHAFTAVGLETVWAETMLVNRGSRRVMAKLGLHHERTEVREWDDPLEDAEQGEVRYVLRRPR